jgi:S-formylglutathione hydrolase FrmB
MAGLLVNGHYQYYPTLASLLGQEARFQTGLDQLDSLRDAAQASGRLPANGVTVEVAIPGTASGFEARDAFVYLPPAWFADPPPALPVLVLASGVPSQTSDWTRGGDADGTADAFAAANGGKAPILAMIDTNGSIDADTECVDGPMAKVETYVVKDVPAYLRSQFGASPAAGSLAIGGLSAGGTCALLVSLRNPTAYPTFADFSGYQTPELDNAGDTLQNLFGGSTEAQQAHDPAILMRQTRFPKSAGWFEAATGDAQPAAAAANLSAAATSSLGQTCVLLRPGGHDFTFWTAALQNALPWLSWRLGLTPVPPAVPATCTPPLG